MEIEQKSQSNKQEHREQRRQEKNALQKSREKKKILKKYLSWIIYLISAGIIIYGLIFIVQQPKSVRPGQAIPIQSRNHISENAPNPKYNSNPPTSGPHASPVKGGFYSGELRDRNVVHNLEHGFVWITYKNVDDKTLTKLEQIAKQFSGSVVISKREANDSPIALASWGRLEKLKAGAFNERLIINFIIKNRNKSPERLAK